MQSVAVFLLFTVTAVTLVAVAESQYTPDWPSIDSRPIPVWYDESKIGIFIHWGVYSVPAVTDEWMWQRWQGWNEDFLHDFMAKNYKPGFTYQEFGPAFTAEFYQPEEWARLFERAGAKYIVLTSKHHDGYALWPSKRSWGWNSMDVGSKRDLLGELAAAVRNQTDLRFGLYHSMYEWFNPLWVQDRDNNFATSDYVNSKVLHELRDIVNTYEPEIVWPDGEWEAHSSYWRSTEFLAWLYNESPVRDTVVVNDRWGSDTRGEHGGFWTGGDRLNPGVLLPFKWENCFTLDKHSWGWRGNANFEDYFTPEEVIRIIVETVSCGGNALVNVGPKKDGQIPLIQQERLLQMGEWLRVNGDAIYGSVPHTVQNDTQTPGVWYTKNEGRNQVYAIVTQGWPGRTLRLGSVSIFDFTSISMLGYTGTLDFTAQAPGILVTMPQLEDVRSKWAYTLVFNNFTKK